MAVVAAAHLEIIFMVRMAALVAERVGLADQIMALVHLAKATGAALRNQVQQAVAVALLL